MIIALDMDGVLADFDKQVEALGFSYPNKSSSELTKEEKAIKNQMYKYLSNNGNTFWKNLPIMPRGKEIFDFVSHNFEFFILTAYTTSGKKECIHGKKEWLKNNFNFIADDANFVCCRSADKGEYTSFKGSKPHILIDDRIKNIQNFRDNDGIGILYSTDVHDEVINKLKSYAKIA
jgi:5'(3')-deoxyribonucleotidase